MRRDNCGRQYPVCVHHHRAICLRYRRHIGLDNRGNRLKGLVFRLNHRIRCRPLRRGLLIGGRTAGHESKRTAKNQNYCFGHAPIVRNALPDSSNYRFLLIACLKIGTDTEFSNRL